MDASVLSLMTLVGQLSEEVNKLQKELDDLKKEVAIIQGEKMKIQDIVEDKEEATFTLAMARDYVMDEIKRRYPALLLTKGSQKLKSKLTISDSTKRKTLRVLIKKSKSYNSERPSGWFVLDENSVQDYDLYIFIITFKDEVVTVLFSPEQMKRWISVKEADSGAYHFYPNVTEGRGIDMRNEVNYDFTEYIENWSIIEEVLSN